MDRTGGDAICMRHVSATYSVICSITQLDISYLISKLLSYKRWRADVECLCIVSNNFIAIPVEHVFLANRVRIVDRSLSTIPVSLFSLFLVFNLDNCT